MWPLAARANSELRSSATRRTDSHPPHGRIAAALTATRRTDG